MHKQQLNNQKIDDKIKSKQVSQKKRNYEDESNLAGRTGT